MTTDLLICFVVFIQMIECANILILHPLYAGSHELTLRSIGNHLVKERGHNVTQIMFQHTNMNMSIASDTDNFVNIVPLRIRDTKNECTRYINQDGQFDIGSFSTKILWKYGEKPWQLPTDLFCVTRVHCNMVLNDPILFESLNASNYDIGRYVINSRPILCVFLVFVLGYFLPLFINIRLNSFVYYLYSIALCCIASFFILFMSLFFIIMVFIYCYYYVVSKSTVRFLLIVL